MKFTPFRLLQLIVILAATYYAATYFNTTKVFGDTASRVLLALGPMLGIGQPYKDLYELVPPGYLLFILIWVKLFGMEIISFMSLHVLLVFINGLLLVSICKELFKNKFLEFSVFFAIVLIINSPQIQTDLFAIDLFGTTLTLAGLAALLNIHNSTTKLSLAITAFILASQFKDIYILSVISLIPFYLRELINKPVLQFLKLVAITAIGPLAITISIILYLVSNDIMSAYWDIIQDKFGFVQGDSANKIMSISLDIIQQLDKFFPKLPNIISKLLILNIGIILIVVLKKRTQYKKTLTRLHLNQIPQFIRQEINKYGENYHSKIVLTILFSISILYGVAMYGMYTGTKSISIITMSVLLIGILLIPILTLIDKTKLKFIGRTIIPLTLLVILPTISILNYKDYRVKRKFTFDVETEIMQRVDKQDCILHIHGWEVAATYIYSRRRPCSRYFLTGELFNIRRNNVTTEYRTHLIENPAAAIIYNEKGADTNFQRFEDEIIAFKKVLSNCYTPDPRYTEYKKHFFATMTLYWPNQNLNKSELKKCWLDNATPISNLPDKH